MGEGYEIKDCDLVNNRNGYSFKKMYIDGTCQFDDFYEEVHASKNEYKDMAGIIALMECFSDTLLPKEKFRQIKDLDRNDIYEFKKKGLRVYVLLCKPDVVIILGGYKKNQKKDINRLKRKLTNLDI